jgi:hypothetical protein
LCSDFGAAFFKCLVNVRVWDFQRVVLKVKKERSIVCCRFRFWSSGGSLGVQFSIDGVGAFNEERCNFFGAVSSVTELAEESGDYVSVVYRIAILEPKASD